MNLRKLSLTQLDALSAKIAARRAQIQRENAGAVRRRIESMVREAGLKLSDVLGGPAPRATATPAVATAPTLKQPVKRKRGRRKAAAASAPAAARKRRGRKPAAKAFSPVGGRAVKGVTYANPKDPKQTWRGAGKRPAWFVAAVSGGKTEADLRAK